MMCLNCCLLELLFAELLFAELLFAIQVFNYFFLAFYSLEFLIKIALQLGIEIPEEDQNLMNLPPPPRYPEAKHSWRLRLGSGDMENFGFPIWNYFNVEIFRM